MLNDTQPLREELERIWSNLVQSHGATADLLSGLMNLTTVAIGLVNRVDELQGEVGELQAELKGLNK